MDTWSKIWLPSRISTSWFVIRKNAEEHAESMFKHTNIKITTEDKSHWLVEAIAFVNCKIITTIATNSVKAESFL